MALATVGVKWLNMLRYSRGTLYTLYNVGLCTSELRGTKTTKVQTILFISL